MLAWNLFGCFWLPIWSLLWSLSLQQDETFAFVNPPPSQSSITNPVYNVGDPIDIQWVGTNAFVSVRLVHYLLDADEFVYVFQNVTNLGGHYTWVIDLGSMNLTSSNTFFFNIFVEGETAPRAVSHNITLANPSSSTTASSATTSTASHTTLSTLTTSTTATASQTSAASISSATTPATSTAAASSGSGLSGGAKAGIGVGVAVGAIAIFAVAFFFWRRSRAGSAAAGGAGGGNGPPYQPVTQQQQAYGDYYKPPPAAEPSELSEGTSRPPVSELSGTGPAAHEMPADTSRSL